MFAEDLDLNVKVDNRDPQADHPKYDHSQTPDFVFLVSPLEFHMSTGLGSMPHPHPSTLPIIFHIT